MLTQDTAFYEPTGPSYSGVEYDRGHFGETYICYFLLLTVIFSTDLRAIGLCQSKITDTPVDFFKHSRRISIISKSNAALHDS